ncbi:MAG: hypothetical protein DRO94_01740 [Candidatus Altiarchaeales archaeon]|nr:MAG: hypothetical protein DRO94_01740 [Candidatus Altiarchaeales archaeon]HDO82158.1 hypothetical protein [Candidatus Altiarchaeales archaeon]HEX54807.1 hypothetical protein [Candidatus Altiarchaeales archaeon]
MAYLALSISIIGLLILKFASDSIAPGISKIDLIDTNSIGRNVRICGNISNIHRFDKGSLLITVNDGSGEIDVYVPYSIAKIIDNKIFSSREIDVIGEVNIYNGRLEIVVRNLNSIRLKNDNTGLEPK